MAAYFLAAAAGAALIGRWMDRVGRRPGLLLSYVLVGAAAAAAASRSGAESFWGLLASTIPFGVGARRREPRPRCRGRHVSGERRGRAVGIVLAAGTVGAVLSPLAAAALEDLAGEGSLLPWIVPIAGALGAIACVAAVRPDPATSRSRTRRSGGVGAPRELLREPPFRTAILAAAVGQMAMVGVMGVTPTALDHAHHGGHDDLVRDQHPHRGDVRVRAADRPVDGPRRPARGARRGCATSIAGALIAATELSAFVVGVGLFAIGLGLVRHVPGRDRVISDITAPNERVGGARLHRPAGEPELRGRRADRRDRARGGRLRPARPVLGALVAVALVFVARLESPPPPEPERDPR